MSGSAAGHTRPLFADLIRFVQRHRDDPAAMELEAALWHWFDEGGRLDAALGVGLPWRHGARLARRDDLLREFYRLHLAPVSLRNAAVVIAQDWHGFERRWWPRLHDQPVKGVPETRLDFLHTLRAEGHDLPGPRRLIDILRPCIVQGVQSTPH